MQKNNLEEFRKLVFYRGALWACYSDIKGSAPEVGELVHAAFHSLNKHIDAAFKATATTRGNDDGKFTLGASPSTAA